MKQNAIIFAIFIVAILGVWLLIKSSGSTDTVTDSYSYDPDSNKIVSVEGGGTNTNTDINNNSEENIMRATLHTNRGDITLEFFADRAPKTVENFTKLAKDGFYNGVKFHRVIKGFMIQGGDPLTKDDSKVDMWGTGGPGYKFADEITPENKNDAGTISMANSGANTNGSQFFINVANNNFLDSKHTVFGRVSLGMEVVKEIENTPTGTADRPLQAVVIESITLE
jgi:peptidylprolyl isomerase